MISPLFADGRSIPLRSRIKPNGNISTTHECSVICGPIGCAVDFVCRLLHLKIISLKNPLQIGLCNKALCFYHDQNIHAVHPALSLNSGFDFDKGTVTVFVQCVNWNSPCVRAVSNNSFIESGDDYLFF